MQHFDELGLSKINITSLTVTATQLNGMSAYPGNHLPSCSPHKGKFMRFSFHVFRGGGGKKV